MRATARTVPEPKVPQLRTLSILGVELVLVDNVDYDYVYRDGSFRRLDHPMLAEAEPQNLQRVSPEQVRPGAQPPRQQLPVGTDDVILYQTP